MKYFAVLPSSNSGLMDLLSSMLKVRTSFTTLMFLFIVISHLELGDGQQRLQIVQDPEDYDGMPSRFHGLRYSVRGLEYMTYQWYHNDTLVNESYTLKFLKYDDQQLQVNPRYVDLRYQGIYQFFASSSFGKIFGRKIRVKFKVIGRFEADEETEKREVIIGEPYRLKCPKHTYSTDCLYKWGLQSSVSGLRHIREYSNRIVLDDGTLLFSSVQERDVREFSATSGGCSCILECTWCNGVRRSHSIVLDGKQGDKKPFGPKIVTNSTDREIVLGTGYVTLRCAAEGSPTPTYRWIKMTKGNFEQDIAQIKDIELGAFNHSLTLHRINKQHNGTYRCIVTSNGREEHMQARIIVREKPTWLSSGKISDKSLDVFTNLTWECKADGDPRPTYTWYANATKLSTTVGKYEINGGRITFSRLLVEDTGMYECVAENGFGNDYQTASLYVRAQKPKFTETNNSVVLLAGSTEGLLRCRSNAIPVANHTWTKDGREIVFSNGVKYDIRDEHDLVIKQVTAEDAGIYKCIATNVFGQDEQTTNVTIGDIAFVDTPKSIDNVVKGETFSLFCKATSVFEIKYRWRFDNRDLVYDDNHIWLLQFNRLVIQNATEFDSGMYECVAYIDAPAEVEKTRKAHVIIQGPPRAPTNFHLKENCTNSSAILLWEPLEIYNHSETYVVIQWRTTYDPQHKWHQFPGRVNANAGKIQVTNLTSWARFQFRATAQNKYGFGDSSVATKFENCETPPSPPNKCPENFHGVPGPPGVLEIRWKAMTLLEYHGPGFKYTLKYKQIDALSWKGVDLERTENRFTIPDAGINQLWYFKIRTYNDEGLGPICPENTSYSGQSNPGPIVNLTIKEIRATTAKITWSSPLGLENIDGYKIEYWKTKESIIRNKRELYRSDCVESNNPCEHFLNRTSNEYRLSSLRPLSYYNLSIRGYNSAGDGPRQYLMFRTAAPTDGKLIRPVHKRSWLITLVISACFLVLLALVILVSIFVFRKRGARYLVRKREQEKGNFGSLEDLCDPSQATDVMDSPEPRKSIYASTETNMDDDITSVFFTEDKYDDGGSFIGEYGDGHAPSRKYEEMFV